MVVFMSTGLKFCQIKLMLEKIHFLWRVVLTALTGQFKGFKFEVHSRCQSNF